MLTSVITENVTLVRPHRGLHFMSPLFIFWQYGVGLPSDLANMCLHKSILHRHSFLARVHYPDMLIWMHVYPTSCDTIFYLTQRFFSNKEGTGLSMISSRWFKEGCFRVVNKQINMISGTCNQMYNILHGNLFLVSLINSMRIFLKTYILTINARNDNHSEQNIHIINHCKNESNLNNN